MCMQSLSLWAEATRYRLQERRRRDDETTPAASDHDAEPPRLPSEVTADRVVPELVGAGRSGRLGE